MAVPQGQLTRLSVPCTFPLCCPAGCGRKVECGRAGPGSVWLSPTDESRMSDRPTLPRVERDEVFLDTGCLAAVPAH